MGNKNKYDSCGDDGGGFINLDCHWETRQPHELVCAPGGTGCNAHRFLSAEESDFHTAELIEATKKINKILADVPENPNGSLSILTLKQGPILAWVKHGGEKVKDAITIDSDPEIVAKHFKLIQENK